MDKANRLLPCPFCMGDAERIELDDAFNEGGSCIACKKCGASSPVHFNFKENLDESWNTRAGQPPAQMRHARPLLVSHALRALEASESQTPHSPHTDFYRILADYIAQLEARGAANDNALPTESKTA